MKSIKVPEPKQLPSGSYRIQIMVDGRSHSITDPDKSSCIRRAAALKLSGQTQVIPVGTLGAAVEAYIAARENVLSPSTIRGYRIIQRNRFQSAGHLKLANLSAADWQRIVNAEAKTCSARTLKNAWGLISSAVREATGQLVSVRLPQVVHAEHAFLEPEQIPVFCEAIRGQRLEIAMLLALHGLRRSEIFGLTWADITDRAINIRGSMVQGADNQMIYKASTKTATSRRSVPIMIPRLAELVAAADKTKPVVDCSANAITRNVNRLCAKKNLPQVGAHGLRRSFASLCYHLGLSEKATMQLGGWSDYGTMRRIYTHLAKKDVDAATEKLSDFFRAHISV